MKPFKLYLATEGVDYGVDDEYYDYEPVSDPGANFAMWGFRPWKSNASTVTVGRLQGVSAFALGRVFGKPHRTSKNPRTGQTELQWAFVNSKGSVFTVTGASNSSTKSTQTWSIGSTSRKHGDTLQKLFGMWQVQGRFIRESTEQENPMSTDDLFSEETLSEGGVKAALEDYMYSIPKAAIEELRPVMKQKASTRKFGEITKILRKHGFTTKFMGSYPSNVVNDYYDAFFGDPNESYMPKKKMVFTQKVVNGKRVGSPRPIPKYDPKAEKARKKKEMEESWGGGFETSREAQARVQAGLKADYKMEKMKRLRAVRAVMNGTMSKAAFKKSQGFSWSEVPEAMKRKAATVKEGAVNWVIEEFMSRIPKGAIKELVPVMKQPGSRERTAKVSKILDKYNYRAMVYSMHTTAAVEHYWKDYYGHRTESTESTGKTFSEFRAILDEHTMP